MKNELQQSDLAPGLVSGEAGTTRDLRWLRLPSLGLRLADSPGRELWESGSERQAQDQDPDEDEDEDQDQEMRILEEALSQASGYLWLEPLGAGWQGPPAELPQKPTLCLATRADQAPPGAAQALPAEVQAFSLQDPRMQEQLQESLRHLPGASPMGEAFLALLLGRLHQARDILLGTLDPTLPSPAMVEPAMVEPEMVEPEMVAAELRRALALLEPEHAQQVPEEILDRIFGRFCLGK